MPEYLSPGVYIEEIEIGAKPIEGVSTSTAGFLGVCEKGPIKGPPQLISSFADFQRIFGGYLPKNVFGDCRFLPHAINSFFINGGKQCYVLRVAPSNGAAGKLTASDFMGVDGGPGNKTGIEAFADLDDVNIMAIPGITNQNFPAVQSALITHCEKLKSRFAILDLPENTQQVSDVKNYRDCFVSSYAAVYHPWIKVFDPLDKIDVFIPPSGSVAGIYARCDNERGVFKAPADEVVLNASGLNYAFSKGEQDLLNPIGVNCIRVFTGRGIRVWGARTCANDSIVKYVNVRRFFIFLQQSILKGTQWVVFEPNNEKLWARITQTVTQFLTSVWRNGGLMGNTQEKAFFVKCDRTTMTQNDIDNGRIIIVVGVAPIKPAEFVIFRIGQWQGGSAATE
jgi:uncharacterized protein